MKSILTTNQKKLLINSYLVKPGIYLILTLKSFEIIKPELIIYSKFLWKN